VNINHQSSKKKNLEDGDVVQSEFPTEMMQQKEGFNSNQYKCFVYFSNDIIKSTYIDNYAKPGDNTPKIYTTENVFECTRDMKKFKFEEKVVPYSCFMLKLQTKNKKIILQFCTQEDFDAFVDSIRKKYPHIPKKTTLLSRMFN